MLTQYKVEGASKLVLRAALRNLKTSLKLFGFRGKYWIKGEYQQYNDNGQNQFCLMGAAEKVNGIGEWVAKNALWEAIEQTEAKPSRFYSVENWNDRKGRKWSEVRKLILKAQRIVQKELDVRTK